VSALRFLRRFHVELHFHVLSALDLPRDAASIYSGRRAPWAKALLEAYRAAPGQLLVQGLPLLVDDLPALLALLREARPRDLQDPAGQALATRLGEALEAEAPGCRAAWEQDAEPAEQRVRWIEAWRAELEGAYAALWSPSPPPPLDVYDCPSLANREGTHGRSLLWRGRLRVALSLAGEPAARGEQVVCQLVHEATHAVTDPPIREAHAGRRHDTRADGEAFALHRELERAAVERGQQVVEEHLPRLREGYRRWRKRHGC
jgi:hypothetical protein